MDITVNYRDHYYRVIDQKPTSDPNVDMCTLVPVTYLSSWFDTIVVPLEVTW